MRPPSYCGRCGNCRVLWMLIALRVLDQDVRQQDTAIKSSERFLNLANDRYKLGIDSYLNVITAQTTYLVNRQALVNLRTQQMTASVLLVEAVGGGWDASQIPRHDQLLSVKRQGLMTISTGKSSPRA